MGNETWQLAGQIDDLLENLHIINRKLDHIMTTQAEFDADLAALTSAVNALLSAYQTAAGGDVDLSAEDSTVTSLTSAINAALNPASADPAPATSGDTTAAPAPAVDAPDPALSAEPIPADPNADPVVTDPAAAPGVR